MSLHSFYACTLRSHIRAVSKDLVYRSALAAGCSHHFFSSCKRLHSSSGRKIMAPTLSRAGGELGASSTASSSQADSATTSSASTTPSALWSNERIEQFLHTRRSLLRSEETNRPLHVAGRETNGQDGLEGAPTEEEVAEARHLAEYLASSPPRQGEWIIDTCLLCFQYQLYDCCCELFFHHAAHRTHPSMLPSSSSRTGAGDADVLFSVVVEAAGRAHDVPALRRCYQFAVSLQPEAGNSSGLSLALTPVTVHLCNLYWHCIRLSLSGVEKVREGDLVALTVQVQEALCVRDGAVTRAADFVKQAQHHYRYSDGERNKKAAICLQLFQHWSTVLGTHQPLRDWLDVTVLHHILRTAVSSSRFDLVEYLTLYVDMLLLVPATHAAGDDQTSEGMFTQRKREWDGVITTMLRYFSISRQVARAVQWLRRLRQQHPGYHPSVSVCVAIARAAASAQDVELSTWCLETLLADQPSTPSARDWFDCICAVARSGLPNYKQVLQSLLENDLLRLTQEELLYVNLLHCRRSCLWREELEPLLRESVPLGEDDAGPSAHAAPLAMQEAARSEETLPPMELLSPRNVHMALLVLHEMEHPYFMRYYRYFLHLTAWRATLEERAKWCIFAVVWATSQTGHLRNDDIYFILQEYAQLVSHAAHASDEDGGRRAVQPRTSHSLQVKWSVLYAQHPEWWWRKLIRKNRKMHTHGAPEPSPSLDLQAVVRPKQSTSGLLTARFLKRKQRVQLRTTSLFLFDGVTEKSFKRGDVAEAHQRDVWSSCFYNKVE